MKKLSRSEDARLRTAAEARLGAEPAAGEHNAIPERPLHELRVSRVELEIQNEELREARHALEESRDRYLSLYEFAPIGYLTVDANDRILETNVAAADLLGVMRKKLVGKRFQGFVATADHDRWWRHLQHTLAQEGRHTLDLAFAAGQGPMSHGRADCVRTLAGDGRPRLRIALTDISDRMKIEQAMAEREAQYRAVIETSADGFWMLDEQGQLRAVNDAYLRRSGYSREEFLALRLEDVEGAESLADIRRHVAKVRREGSDLFETWHLTKSGKRWPVEVNVAYWPEAGGRIFAFLRDISERKQAEAALLDSEARFRATFEQAAVGIGHVAPDGRWLRVNGKLCDIVGYSREELLKLTFQQITYPDDLPADLELVRRTLAGEIQNYAVEKRYLRKDGSIVWITLTTVLTRRADGAPDYFISVIEDISARKKAEGELRALRAETERLIRFQVASQTAAAIAHELNQPLNAIATYAEAALRLLNAGGPANAKLRQALEGSAQQAQRAGRVVRDLLEFMARDNLETEALPLNDTVRRVARLLHGESYRGIHFQFDLEHGLAPVRANRLQVEKVLTNLIENSIEAMHEAGIDTPAITVTVRTSANGKMAQATITDRGPGIDADTLQNLFQPFFTTKPKGLGLGLAISRAIIEAHGGQLWVESEPGAGASFHLTLPFAI